MSPSEADFRSLDIVVAAKVPAKRVKALVGYAARVGRKSHGQKDPDTLIGASLLPAQDGGLVAVFHVDTLQDSPGWVFCHVTLTRAVREPPAEVKALRSAGYTAEWAIDQIGRLVGSRAVPLDLSVHGLIKARSLGGVRSTLFMGGRLLEPKGIEFEHPDVADGPYHVRVKNRDEGLEFWLEYRTTETWKAKPWEQETARSAQFLQELLAQLA